jgi:tetratricopeptide (TPR) repeat protein
VVWPKRLLYLVVGGLILFLLGRLEAGWIVRLTAVVLPLAALEAVLYLMVKSRSVRFDKRLMSLLQAGRSSELLPLYQQQGLLRFAAPRHYTQGKLGLIYARLDRHAEAADAYREALDSAPEAKRYMLSLGLANSLFEAGEGLEAEQVYREIIDKDHVNVQACANLSQLIRTRGGELADAERYLRMAVDTAGGGARRCELVHLLLARGKNEEAAWQLRLATEELASGDGNARDALHEARDAARSAGIDLDAAPPKGEAGEAGSGEGGAGSGEGEAGSGEGGAGSGEGEAGSGEGEAGSGEEGVRAPR